MIMKSVKSKKIVFYFVATIIGLLITQACQSYYFRSNYKDANKLLHETKNLQKNPYLKAHLKNGDICILKDSWQIDTTGNIVTGFGTRYNFNRLEKAKGLFHIPIDSVAIFETNKKLENTESSRITALTIVAAADAFLGALCLANPKACFGSCPTFYTDETSNFHYADAEGFSSAILPSMEYSDIDALDNQQPVLDKAFSITMKNEAQETHCVNRVKLLVCPRGEGERVYQSPNDQFYLCRNQYSVKRASGPEGDITALLGSADRKERFSLADAQNLSSKEEIYLDFNNIKNSDDLGLLVSFRQTLMTTYFTYSAMGYMGDEVGDIFASVERNSQMEEKLKNGIKKELGGIDVYVWNEQKRLWESQGGFFEIGPIAFNHQILPLTQKALGSDLKMKIVLNKGLWRIDYLALTNINKKVTPVKITPESVFNKGEKDDLALAQINTSGKYLISMPGSAYKFNFTLPAGNQDYELFLYAKGYYLEWMRAHWFKEKNLLKLRQMVENPKTYLRTEAEAYKQYETTMERDFWNSKIDTKTFSYYEN